MNAVRTGCEPVRFDRGHIGAYLQHGFSGCPASMRPMAEWLAEREVSVVAPLLPGHGTRWEDLEHRTWRQWAEAAEGALVDLAARSTTVVAVGQSMGGAMVLHLAARRPELIDAAVVINADVRRPILALAPVVRLFRRTVKGIGNDIKKPGQQERAYEQLPVEALGQLHRFYRTVWAELPAVRAPLVVFSSVEDHVVNPGNSRAILERVGSEEKELVPLANSYHVASLDNDAEVIFERVLALARASARSAR